MKSRCRAITTKGVHRTTYSLAPYRTRTCQSVLDDYWTVLWMFVQENQYDRLPKLFETDGCLLIYLEMLRKSRTNLQADCVRSSCLLGRRTTCIKYRKARKRREKKALSREAQNRQEPAKKCWGRSADRTEKAAKKGGASAGVEKTRRRAGCVVLYFRPSCATSQFVPLRITCR